LGGVGAIVVYGRIAVGWGRCGAPAHIATDEREERQAQYQNAYYNGKKFSCNSASLYSPIKRDFYHKNPRLRLV
jgi:hypothetical protein